MIETITAEHIRVTVLRGRVWASCTVAELKNLEVFYIDDDESTKYVARADGTTEPLPGYARVEATKLP